MKADLSTFPINSNWRWDNLLVLNAREKYQQGSGVQSTHFLPALDSTYSSFSFFNYMVLFHTTTKNCFQEDWNYCRY
jgi:hypothetical protein